MWLVAGNQPKPEVIRFLTGVVKGLAPTAVLLVVLIVCLRRGIPFVGALIVAFIVWGGSSFLLARTGW